MILNGTTYGVRSSSRVAIKKSINDCTSLPHSPSNSTHSSPVNDVGKSSRNADALTTVAAAFISARHSSSNLTQPSSINDVGKSSGNVEASTPAAVVVLYRRTPSHKLHIHPPSTMSVNHPPLPRHRHRPPQWLFHRPTPFHKVDISPLSTMAVNHPPVPRHRHRPQQWLFQRITVVCWLFPPH